MSKRPYKPRRKPARNFGHKIENHAAKHSIKHPAKQLVKKINSKLLNSYILIAYAFVSVVIILFACHGYHSYLERKRLQMEAAAYEVEMNFSSTLGYAESVLNHINRQIVSSNGTSAEIAEILGSFNRAHYGYSSIKDMLSAGMFYWIDDKQQLIASSAGPVASPIDLSSRDYLNQTKQDPWRIYGGMPIVGAASGQYVIPAGVGVVDRKGTYVGTSVVSFKIYNLVEKFRHLTDYYKADFAILDNDNKVMLESTSGLFSEDNNLVNNLKLSDQSLHQELVSSFSPFKQKGSYIIVRNFEKYPYKILVGYQNNVMTKEIFVELMPRIIEFLVITIFFATMLIAMRGGFKK